MATDLPLEGQFQALLDRLANRDGGRTETTIQSDIRQLLLTSGLGLGEDDLEVGLETPLGGGRRIGVEVGFTVIEVKKDLRRVAVIKSATKQLAEYVASRSQQKGQCYVGILIDGDDWRAYHLTRDELVEATRYELNPSRHGLVPLLTWREGVLAVRTGTSGGLLSDLAPTIERMFVTEATASSCRYLSSSRVAATLSQPTIGLADVRLLCRAAPQTERGDGD